LSPTVSLRAVLPGLYDCELCNQNDPAPGVTSLSSKGLLQEFDVMLRDMQDVISKAKPAAPTEADSNDPYTRLEQVFAARFAPVETSGEAAPAFIAVAGPVNAEDYRPAIEQALGAPSGARHPATLFSSKGDIRVHIPEDKAQTALGYMVGAPALDEKDVLAWRLALYMFSHGYGGRLGNEAISERGLAYYVSADYRSGANAGLVTLNIGVDPDKQQALLETLKAELKRFVAEPPDEAELAEAKRHLIGRKISAAQSNEEITAALAQDWAGPDLMTIDAFTAAVSAITLDEVRAVLPAFAAGDTVVISAGDEKHGTD
jgi:predicted Zn-dependent peptidase